jgi:hypothetical protein
MLQAAGMPVIESTPLSNPFWQDSRRQDPLPGRPGESRWGGRPAGPIVQPSHTYDKTLLLFDSSWTVVDRMELRVRRWTTVTDHA